MKFNKYFENFPKSVKKSHNKTFFGEVSKIFAEFEKVFNFEKFQIYVFPKLKLNLICASCCLDFLIGNLT